MVSELLGRELPFLAWLMKSATKHAQFYSLFVCWTMQPTTYSLQLPCCLRPQSSTVLPICQVNRMYPVNSVLVPITCWAQNAEGSFNEAQKNILAVVIHLRKPSASELRSFCDEVFRTDFTIWNMNLLKPYQNVLLFCLPWILMMTDTTEKGKTNGDLSCCCCCCC